LRERARKTRHYAVVASNSEKTLGCKTSAA
jgi:hypothetical protein